MLKLLSALALFGGSFLFAQNAALQTDPNTPFFDNNGRPAAGGKLYTCVAGTSCPGNPLATYTDSTSTVQNANPVILDSAGRAPVYIGTGPYKFVLQNSAGVTLWTRDNISNVLLKQAGQLGGSNGTSLINYTPSGTGVVARTLSSVLDERKSILNYCATGTSDYSTCLQAAINDIEYNGGTLFLPPGIYNFGSTLNITGSINIEGAEESSNHASGFSIGADLHYTGTGTAIYVHRTTANGITYRVKFVAWRLSSGTGNIGVQFDSWSECELRNFGIGDGYSTGGGFNTGLSLVGGGGGLFTAEDLIVTTGGVGIDLENAAIVTITRGNIANNSIAHLRLGASTGYVSISDTFFEGSPIGVLVDDNNSAGYSIINDVTFRNVRFLDTDAYAWGNARCVSITNTHPSDSTHIVTVARMRFVDSTCQASYSVKTPSPNLISVVGNGAPTNRFNVTDLEFSGGYYVGATASTSTADTSSAQVRAINVRSINSAFTTVPFFGGSGQYFAQAQNGSGMDYTGHVGVLQEGEALALKGTNTTWLGFYQTGGSRTGYIGQSVNGNGGLLVHNDVSGMPVYLQPTGGGSVHITANTSIGPVDFSPTHTLDLQDNSASGGSSTLAIKLAIGQATRAFQINSNAGSEIFAVASDGTPVVSGVAGFSGTKVAGSCTLTITKGIITAVSGC